MGRHQVRSRLTADAVQSTTAEAEIMSLYQSNISHHERRAQEWLASGRPDYAEGSMRKAAKWRLKERELPTAIHGLYPKDALGTLMDDQFEAISSRFASDMERALFGY